MYEDIMAERLAKLRTQRGISAREMSLAIGQNENYINRIENKQAFPSMQGFFYICEYLKITPEEFFAIDTDNPQEVRELADCLKRLDGKQIFYLKGFIQSLK